MKRRGFISGMIGVITGLVVVKDTGKKPDYVRYYAKAELAEWNPPKPSYGIENTNPYKLYEEHQKVLNMWYSEHMDLIYRETLLTECENRLTAG